MRVAIHDYSGHPFQVQLSRALAKRGYDVLHLFSGSFQTPRGSVCKLSSDPKCFDCYGIFLPQPFEKYSFVKRRFQEVEYGKLLIQEIIKFAPDVVISSNTPLDSQKILLKECKKRGIKFIFWLQDLWSAAIKETLTKKYYVLGTCIGLYYIWLEASILRDSDKVVAITEDFIPLLKKQRIKKERIDIINNWAPIEEIPVFSKANQWSKEKGLHNKFCFLYSGTLGLKHNPDFLLGIAKHFSNNDDIRLVVVSEGLGANYLKKKKKQLNLDNLILFGVQPYEQLPQVLGSADILIAILKSESGKFSVPSKVLTYHCAARPMLLAVPQENLSAEIVLKNSTGVVVPPDDRVMFVKTAEELYKNKELRISYGENARKYAENEFNIEKITDKFIKVFSE